MPYLDFDHSPIVLTSLEQNMAHRYVEVLIDDEIPEEIFCSVASDYKENIFDDLTINCGEEESFTSVPADLYDFDSTNHGEIC